MFISKRNTWVSLCCLAVLVLVAAALAASAPGPTSTHGPSSGAQQLSAATATSVPPVPEKPEAESCLGCHGPFEELAKRTAAYVTDHGEKVNPHMYVPHDSKKITACNNCHDAHPMPVTSPGNIAKANVQYCYSACHHENDFTPCVQCHKDKK